MTHIGYVASAYIASFGGLALLTIYVLWDLRKEKARLDRLDQDLVGRGRTLGSEDL